MKKLVVLASVFFSVVTWADMGVEVGFRSQSGAGASGTSAKSETGYQAGVVGQFPLSGQLAARAGLMYTQRPLTVTDDTTQQSTKAQLNYFDVPVALMYKFDDAAGVFAGVVLGMNLDSSCSGVAGCKINDPKSMVTPFQLGASFKFAPQVGATVYFETMSGDVAQNLSNYRAVGANLLITFD